MVGVEMGPTGWFTLKQEHIDAFADLTGDRQWIHVDVDRAADTSTGSTIGHGLFTLALGPRFTGELMGRSTDSSAA
jgi:acyl dehydratase